MKAGDKSAMFQFSYFFLFVAIGFASGYTNPDVPDHRRKPISIIFGVISIIGFILIIWSAFSFGFFWGIISALEFWLGYHFGRKISLG
ncbi:hypothetical protein OA500_00840 [Gammaproteobacteria bacterium]|nr:hypothetical protein [Gammaproteobacteria bacterium]